MSTHTFIATAAAVKHVGATPIVVDCDRFSCLDPTSVLAAITPATKAIMPTQLNGRICDMNSLVDIANQHGLCIIEDSCQALGALISLPKLVYLVCVVPTAFSPLRLLVALAMVVPFPPTHVMLMRSF